MPPVALTAVGVVGVWVCLFSFVVCLIVWMVCLDAAWTHTKVDHKAGELERALSEAERHRLHAKDLAQELQTMGKVRGSRSGGGGGAPGLPKCDRERVGQRQLLQQ